MLTLIAASMFAVQLQCATPDEIAAMLQHEFGETLQAAMPAAKPGQALVLFGNPATKSWTAAVAMPSPDGPRLCIVLGGKGNEGGT